MLKIEGEGMIKPSEKVKTIDSLWEGRDSS